MISIVVGEVRARDAESLTVDVHGIGLRVLTTPAVIAGVSTGERIELFTTLVVREDSLTMFGFGEQTDRMVFEKLQSVSGVGPRIAVAALSVYSASELRDMIQFGDEKGLTRISGIGKKGAQRLILELTDKITISGLPDAIPNRQVEGSTSHDQVIEALVGLGWQERQAADVVDAVVRESRDGAEGTPQADVSTLLSESLRRLGRR